MPPVVAAAMPVTTLKFFTRVACFDNGIFLACIFHCLAGQAARLRNMPEAAEHLYLQMDYRYSAHGGSADLAASARSGPCQGQRVPAAPVFIK